MTYAASIDLLRAGVDRGNRLTILVVREPVAVGGISSAPPRFGEAVELASDIRRVPEHEPFRLALELIEARGPLVVAPRDHSENDEHGPEKAAAVGRHGRHGRHGTTQARRGAMVACGGRAS